MGLWHPYFSNIIEPWNLIKILKCMEWMCMCVWVWSYGMITASVLSWWSSAGSGIFLGSGFVSLGFLKFFFILTRLFKSDAFIF